MEWNYWEASKKLIATKTFRQDLENLDPSDISDNIIETVRDKYISRTADFNPKRVEKASSAAMGLCLWILGMDEYVKVVKYIKPKQEKL